MCTEQLPPGGYPIAVKYVVLYMLQNMTKPLPFSRFTNVKYAANKLVHNASILDTSGCHKHILKLLKLKYVKIM